MTAYLDHAATTPMWPAAIETYAAVAARVGNASSLHTAGRKARAVVEESRERIAAALGARPSEVVFTSGGTESDNLAVKGTYAARHGADPRRRLVVASAVEHHAVLDPMAHLVAAEGAEVLWLQPDQDGRIGVEGLRRALEADPESVALVTVMWANNEVGTVQPVADLAALAHEHEIPFHTDAVQAVATLPVEFAASGADLLALTGHKLGGPLGTGILLARREAVLQPLTHGGGQERQVRSGTLDVPGIASLATAIEQMVRVREAETARLTRLRDRLLREAIALPYGITVTGAWTPGDATTRLASNAHLLVPETEGDSLLYLLDAAGVEVSTGSACQAGVPQPSHVVLALGHPEDRARGALRITLGHTSTEEDVDAFLAALPVAVERARSAKNRCRVRR